MKPPLLTIASTLAIIASVHGELVSNGDFKEQPPGTTVQLLVPDGGVDTMTFPDWRLYSDPVAGTPVAAAFTATAVGDAAAGTTAIRLDVDNTNSAPENWGMDNSNAKIPVESGKDYSLSFDAALVSGNLTGNHDLLVVVDEWDSDSKWLAGTYIGFPIVEKSSQPFSIPKWTPKNPDTVQISILFRPRVANGEAASMTLTNIRFGISDPKY